MKKILTLILLLTIALISKDKYLKLDTKGHTSLINDIIVTKSGDIISASDDKTIRIWGSQTGREKRKILGQIGEGSKGAIYAIALSPDKKYLAVGGYLDKKFSYRYGIRIYNYKTGKLIKVLKSHSNVVLDLSFSKDGKYLISGSGDFTAKIWRVKDFRLKDTIRFHKRQVYAVKIIKKGRRYFAVTAGYDKKIALYDIKRRKIVKYHTLDYMLQFLATSKNSIAVSGFGKEIKIYDFNLKLLKTIKSETEPLGLAYSRDGKLLISGSGNYPNNTNVYDVVKGYKKIISFNKHKNLTMAVGFLNNLTAISAGGDNKEIYIWRIKDGKVLKKIVGVGKAVYSVGINGNKIAWGNINPCPECENMGNRFGKLQKYINLNSFEIKSLNGDNSFHRVNTTL